MKFFKRVVIFILVLLVIWSVAALFCPKVIHVERSMIMKSDAKTVFTQINTLKNWKTWSFWDNIDTKTMKDEFTGPESGVGAKHAWESPNDSVGKGSITISKSEENKFVGLELHFDGKGDATSAWKIADTTGGVNVTTYIDFAMPFFMRPMCLFMNMDKMLGPDFERSLSNLKTIAEKPVTPDYMVVEKDQASMMILSIPDSVKSVNDIGPKLGALYGEIGMQVGKAGAKMAGPVFCIYHHFAPNRIIMEAGVQVDKKISKTEGRVKYWETKGGKVVSVDYYGSYDKMQPVYDIIKKWAADNNKKLSTDAWEIYIGDPGIEKDWSKILTQVVFAVE